MTGEGNDPNGEKAQAEPVVPAPAGTSGGSVEPGQPQGADAPTPALTPLDPRMLKVLRIRGAIFGLFVHVPLAALDFTAATPLPFGPLSLAGLGILLAATFLLPRRRYRAWGWARSADELHVGSG